MHEGFLVDPYHRPMDRGLCLGCNQLVNGNSREADGANGRCSRGYTITDVAAHQTFLSSKTTRTDILASISLFELRKWGTVNRLVQQIADYGDIDRCRQFQSPSAHLRAGGVLWP